jgi:enterochelin esterase-like enzyme
MARGTVLNLVRLPIQLRVGVGGLEPPTSASQTRRAGRLRYTPADKSIIPSMRKRQETATSPRVSLLHVILLLITGLILVACQQNPVPITPTAPPAATGISPTQHQEQEPSESLPTSIIEPPISTDMVYDCLQIGGDFSLDKFESELLGEEFYYQVYLPPCYRENINTHYPVVFLLHGLVSDENHWPRLGLGEIMDSLIRQNMIPEFIIVMPRETRFLSPVESRFPEAILLELIPHIDEQYRTMPERAFRKIGGISRGAAWAVHIGFTYPEVFGAVGAHSLPLFQSDSAKLSTWLSTTSSGTLPLFFIDIGRSDPERTSAEAFANQLDEYHVPHIWYLFTGGHSDGYWSENLVLYLKWYADNW